MLFCASDKLDRAVKASIRFTRNKSKLPDIAKAAVAQQAHQVMCQVHICFIWHLDAWLLRLKRLRRLKSSCTVMHETVKVLRIATFHNKYCLKIWLLTVFNSVSNDLLPFRVEQNHSVLHC
jgi:hypothetical protein